MRLPEWVLWVLREHAGTGKAVINSGPDGPATVVVERTFKQQDFLDSQRRGRPVNDE